LVVPSPGSAPARRNPDGGLILAVLRREVPVSATTLADRGLHLSPADFDSGGLEVIDELRFGVLRQVLGARLPQRAHEDRQG
jgi:hypothetical protein